MDAPCAPWSKNAARESRLPYRPPSRAWAGHGSGRSCHLCRQPIDPHQIEYEVELLEAAQPLVLYLHVGCYHQWASMEQR